jgi:hypothetical protein
MTFRRATSQNAVGTVADPTDPGKSRWYGFPEEVGKVADPALKNRFGLSFG